MSAVLLAAGGVVLAALCRRYRHQKEEKVRDGGVSRHTTGTDAPKTVRSSEITDFECRFSLFAIPEEDLDEGMVLKNADYLLKAKRGDNGVQGLFRWVDRFGNGEDFPFLTESSFMEELQKITAKHNLAKHNGYFHEVQGLPDFYGASLYIRYASGEVVAANDNQDNFLSVETMSDLATLFITQS